MREPNAKWYVLNPNGKTMAEVIANGPFDEGNEARLYNYEVHCLDANRIDIALGVEMQLQTALARYGGSYGTAHNFD